MKILIIEDEIALLESIISYFEVEGVICESAVDFNTAIEKVSLYNYDCIIVDINLPGGSGLEIIEYLKKNKNPAGIIIVSARDTLEDRIKGLELGADDYLTKPFDLAELNIRVKSLYRRINFQGNNFITAGKLEVHPGEFTVHVSGEILDLTKKEYDLLLFLISNQNRVITKETIAEHLWGDYIDTADSFDFVYTHIKNLRKKLQDKGIKDYLQNIYGVGYKFQIE
jgi:DNA-binding response OmpR family regulator